MIDNQHFTVDNMIDPSLLIPDISSDEKMSTFKLKDYLNVVEYPSKSLDESIDNILNNVFDQVESTNFNSNSDV